MLAMYRHAKADRLSLSQSLYSLRFGPTHAKVRSTTQPLPSHGLPSNHERGRSRRTRASYIFAIGSGALAYFPVWLGAMTTILIAVFGTR